MEKISKLPYSAKRPRKALINKGLSTSCRAFLALLAEDANFDDFLNFLHQGNCDSYGNCDNYGNCDSERQTKNAKNRILARTPRPPSQAPELILDPPDRSESVLR